MLVCWCAGAAAAAVSCCCCCVRRLRFVVVVVVVVAVVVLLVMLIILYVVVHCFWFSLFGLIEPWWGTPGSGSNSPRTVLYKWEVVPLSSLQICTRAYPTPYSN